MAIDEPKPTSSGTSKAFGTMLVAVLAGIPSKAKSVAIAKIQRVGSASPTIEVEEKIEVGNEAEFRMAMQGKTRAVILFSRPGGNLLADLRVGDEIRNGRFSTGCSPTLNLGQPELVPSSPICRGKFRREERSVSQAAFIGEPDGCPELGAGSAYWSIPGVARMNE
ncbi:hypothetical protein [Microvirga arsenatis]|uniref:Uncharacterized protein n=1 Tax=Microvirga arsenatis TaxID=2692265 RepID=A0ABW9Z3V8_9HYPH|nr:hypothetical protein [Microvirga arsenatis]NBJ13763.1 hypothetical protein [Microvirga arsenatis]NBJ27217.1 hypothetical protein [Microvirga arsenatis]